MAELNKIEVTFVGTKCRNEGCGPEVFIVISGIIPQDDDLDIPDPVIRLCYKQKQKLLEEEGRCVAFWTERTTDFGGRDETVITFIYSHLAMNENDKGEIGADEVVVDPETARHWENILASRCAKTIQEYLDTRANPRPAPPLWN